MSDRKAYCEMSHDELGALYDEYTSLINDCVLTCIECDYRESCGFDYVSTCPNTKLLHQYRRERDIIFDLLYPDYFE